MFSSSVSACRIMPDCSDFTMYTVETKAGTPDPKTGIPPSLYTLTVTDFLDEQGESTDLTSHSISHRYA